MLDEAPDFPDHAVDFGAIYTWKLPVLRQAAECVAQERRERAARRSCARNLSSSAKRTPSGWTTSHSSWRSRMRMTERPGISGRWRCAAANLAPSPQRPKPTPATSTTTRSTSGSSTASGSSSRPTPTRRASRSSATSPSSSPWTAPTPGPTRADFFLDDEFQPTVVAGVPPDYFSKTGQLWGNPLYRWKAMKEDGYAWWLRRIRAALAPL